MKYLNFSVEDFAADDFFIKWVIGNDFEAGRFWEEYRLQNPQKAHAIDNARILLLNLRRAEQTSQASLPIARMWRNIETQINDRHGKEKQPSTVFIPVRLAATIALIVVILTAGGYGIAWKIREQTATPEQLLTQSEDFIEELNTTGGVLKIHLNDGSVVSLENNSRLKYRKDYASQPERKVYLTGEGYFDIAKNPHKPFFVYANEVVTKVLGTSFRIKAYHQDKHVTVSVRHGKVSVFSAKEPRRNSTTPKPEINGVILTPNQQVIYQRSNDSFEKALVEKPEVIDTNIQKANFLFDNEPIGNVFHTLEKAYGVEIIFEDVVMQNCFLTAPLGNEPLFEKLKIICKTIGANYELIDAKIVITSKGCGKPVSKKPIHQYP